VELHQGKIAEAISTLSEALAVEEANAECGPLVRAQTYNLLGYAYMALEQWKKSRNLIEAGLAPRTSVHGEDSPRLGRVSICSA
jgi:Flp pilus assembly protein TadD